LSSDSTVVGLKVDIASPKEDGLLVLPLALDNAPFLDALVSGALVPFGPARRDPPSTTVRLPGGVETHRGLRRCAAELAP
jgi:hypothetical protein